MGELAVADSWRVSDGRVVGLAEHLRRFEASAAAGAPAGADVDWPPFWDAAAAAVPTTGRWWPRVELPHDGPPRVLVRPAPPRRVSTRLAWCGGDDPRTAPRTKGPDLAVLAGLRDDAVASGADCALLTGGGSVREAATGSVLWWEGDVLCAPDDEQVLPGVTAGLVLDHARASGVPSDRRARRPEELAGREVWFTSALHGVTGVVSLTVPGGVVPLAAPRRAARWHRAWVALAQGWSAPPP